MTNKQRIPDASQLKYALYERLQSVPMKDFSATKTALMKEMGIGQHTLNRLMRTTFSDGRNAMKGEYLAAAAKVFGCTMEELIRKPKSPSRGKKIAAKG